MYKKILLKALLLFATYAVAGMIQKPIFLILFHNGATSLFGDCINVISHGFAMDCTVAGYLTAMPILFMAVECMLRAPHTLRRLERGYAIATSILIGGIFALNLGLYPHWGFPLDTTPLFYFTTAPSSALASVTPLEAAIGLTGWILFSLMLYAGLRIGALRIDPFRDINRRSALPFGETLLLAALLILPIRGGVTVSTMNLSRSYFSQTQLLNHAAVNPFFSLLYSATHQTDFGKQFQFFPKEEAAQLFADLRDDSSQPPVVDLLATRRPDILLIILESFSNHLFPSLGGDSIAIRLDSVGREGMIFTNLYASSFRTDRGIPAILSGFAAQPTTSLMKFADKTEHLPSLPRRLAENGWQTDYYYGGDINFTNMLSYLINCGFTNIVRDTDFPLSERTGKWGAHDHLLFKRALEDMQNDKTTDSPHFRVIQTSSSHEPFEVPFRSHLSSKEANAFAYTDSCTADFLNLIRSLPRYDSTLVVLVPDHYGAWPRGLERPVDRHHIPLILTGGALTRRGETVDSIASQTDIAATLLSQLHLDRSDFKFSNDIFNPAGRDFAFFSDRNFASFIDQAGVTTLNIDSNETISTPADTALEKRETLLRAYLQTIYATLSSLE